MKLAQSIFKIFGDKNNASTNIFIPYFGLLRKFPKRIRMICIKYACQKLFKTQWKRMDCEDNLQKKFGEELVTQHNLWTKNNINFFVAALNNNYAIWSWNLKQIFGMF